MKILNKIRKNAKALSPVVASIILIAVTVAVSIAVAAWMGGMTTGFMKTEQVAVTYVSFFGTSPGTAINVTVSNSGSSSVVITTAVVNGQSTTITGAPVTVPGNTAATVIELTGTSWTTGLTYDIKLTSQKGNSFSYSAVAP